jgi:hypothetical protein
MNRSTTLPTITATELSTLPTWALLERQLIEVMEQAAELKVSKYSERSGVPYYADDVDDLYEMIFNWGLFYAMGANERVLELALQHWNAVTRFGDDRIVSRVHDRFTQQVHKEYYGLVHPGDAEWHHKGEGNMAFYHFGLADPTISENVRRSRLFASFYLGENSDAPNYDPRYKILRSPFQTSQGPWLKADPQRVHAYLWGGQGSLGGRVNFYGTRSSLYPIVKDLEEDWWKEPKRRDEIVGLFDKIVLNADSPNSLGATALITNAYLYTGDSRYKDWVIEYTDAWMDRIQQNNGVVPDNVGPTGKIGEHRQGQWWGGIYGWNSYCGFNIIFHSLTIAAECAHLLTGDSGYLDLLRSQIKVLIDNGITREDGQFLQAVRHGPEGWGHKMWNPLTGLDQPVRMNELAHLYHASLSEQDRQLVTSVRDGDVSIDWNENKADGANAYSGMQEYPRFQYYDNKNPDWPTAMLRAELENALKTYDEMRNDERTVEQIIADNRVPANPVHTKALTHVTLGAPQSVYHGGLLRATVRYFDPDNDRPGLPRDVAALVDELKSDCVGVELVNLNRNQTRRVVVQAGAFGEHQFTRARYRDGESQREVAVEGKYVSVELPPLTAIRLGLGMRRFVNDPSYGFPWHGDGIPVPFPPA